MYKLGSVEIGKPGEFPLLLAPMEQVTQPFFRLACRENGADVSITEFISAEGLIRDAHKSIKKLEYFEQEKPGFGIQIFGGNEDSMLRAIEVVESESPDFISLNCGCPSLADKFEAGGASVLKDIPKMERLARILVKKTKLPVSVKTRLGYDYNSIRIVEVAERLQDSGVQEIVVHARTRSEMYKNDATRNWYKIAEIKNNPRINIPVIGNGDVTTPERAKEMMELGLDGCMIGRAAIGNPWFFSQTKHFLKHGKHADPPTIIDRIKLAERHLKASIKFKGEKHGLLETRRHYSNYFKNIPDFKQYRSQMVTLDCSEELFELFNNLKEKFSQKNLTEVL